MLCRRTQHFAYDSALVVVLAVAAGFSFGDSVSASSSPASADYQDRSEECTSVQSRILQLQAAWRGSSADSTLIRDVAKKGATLDRRREQALADRWGVHLVAAELLAESERLIQTSSWPDRLLQIYVASTSSELFQECVVRPRWARREFNRRFAADKQIHADARAEARELVRRLRLGELDRTAPVTGRTEELRSSVNHRDDEIEPASWLHGVSEPIELARHLVVVAELPGSPELAAVYRIPKPPAGRWLEDAERFLRSQLKIATQSHRLGVRLERRARMQDSGLLDDVWQNGALDFLRERQDHTVVWTGTEMLIWGGRRPFDAGDNSGYRYDPALNFWEPISTVDAPSGRFGHVAVWSGSEMLIWGSCCSNVVKAGGRYNPATDSWSPMTIVGAPENRSFTEAVWTGTEMLVWGGGRGSSTLFASGGRYDPATDSWQPIQPMFAPSPRRLQSAIWTGTRLAVWGGLDVAGNSLATGALYSPALNRWFPMSAPPTGFAPRSEHASVWTGSELLIWGGRNGSGNSENSGALYDPDANSWLGLPDLGSPSGNQVGAEAFSNGSEILLVSTRSTGEGGRYDRSTNSWLPSLPPYPSLLGESVWTGTEILSWGFARGFRLSPGVGTWTPIPQPGSLSPRRDHTAIWTGAEMIVWGGADELPPFEFSLDDGAAYDPVLDVWAPISGVGAPTARQRHVATWTGDEMLVWGPLDDPGGRYDPLTDSWASIESSVDSCEAESAVWTGEEWLVWGGGGGCRFEPTSGSWSAIATSGAPSAEVGSSIVWTGSEMVVWGGRAGSLDLATGAAYDPVSNSWRDLASSSAPSARRNHAAVWTGESMLVWGGTEPDPNSVGRWDPVPNSWTISVPLSSPDNSLSGPAITWTGAEFLVWGGDAFAPAAFGGRYDPTIESWSAVSLDQSPNERTNHTGVWTGREFLIWGGVANGFGLTVSSGGSYRVAADSDGDGVVGQLDCSPLDASAFAIPDAITGVSFHAPTALHWDSAVPSSGSGTVHDIIRMQLPWTVASWDCEATGLTASSYAASGEPTPGKGFAYLIVGRNSCGSGDLGNASSGEPRLSSACE